MVFYGRVFIMDNLLNGISIRNQFGEKEIPGVIRGVLEATKNESDLSKRSAREIKRHIRKEELFCLYSRGNLAGFVISSKIGKKTAEVSGLFVGPELRGNSYADFLMEAATANKKTIYVAVTYNGKMRERLARLGFALRPFAKLGFEARAGILISRAKAHRVLEILRHLGENKEMTFFVK
jgi:N-acetylglutamate synthase-like GNAT family acetyltransferase